MRSCILFRELSSHSRSNRDPKWLINETSKRVNLISVLLNSIQEEIFEIELSDGIYRYRRPLSHHEKFLVDTTPMPFPSSHATKIQPVASYGAFLSGKLWFELRDPNGESVTIKVNVRDKRWFSIEFGCIGTQFPDFYLLDKTVKLLSTLGFKFRPYFEVTTTQQIFWAKSAQVTPENFAEMLYAFTNLTNPHGHPLEIIAHFYWKTCRYLPQFDA